MLGPGLSKLRSIPRAGNKFNAEKTESNDRVFHSGDEVKRSVDLQWLLHLGQISDLQY
jgi:hypothetical protein